MSAVVYMFLSQPFPISDSERPKRSFSGEVFFAFGAVAYGMWYIASESLNSLLGLLSGVKGGGDLMCEVYTKFGFFLVRCASIVSCYFCCGNILGNGKCKWVYL